MHAADQQLAVRQVLAAGRLAERITDRGIADVSGTLSFRVGVAAPWRPLAVQFAARAEGFFAFSLHPEREFPNLSAFASVTLRAEFARVAVSIASVERTVLGSALTLETRTSTIADQTFRGVGIRGAPFDLSVEVDPAPVALAGIVLRNHDPAQAIAGVQVAAGVSRTVTDSTGRFFLPALPLAARISLELTEGAMTTPFPLHVDYARPVNHVTVSLAS